METLTMIYTLEGKDVVFSLKYNPNENQSIQRAKCVFVSEKFIVLSYEESHFKNVWIPIDNFIFVMEE